MSQIQSGYNYNTTTNKIVTANNLNSHVNNAILVAGSISEQQTLEDPIDTLDSFLVLDESAGILVNATLQQLWNSLPTDLIVTSVTTNENEDIVVYKDESNTGNPKVYSLIDAHIGTDFEYEQIGALSNWESYPKGHPTNYSYLSVNDSIVNAWKGSSGGGISSLNFGYKNDRQPIDQGGAHRGNRFYFYGHGTEFIGTDNLEEGYENEIHPVTIGGPLTVNYAPETENTFALTVDGNASVGGVLTVGGFEYQKTVYREVTVGMNETIANGGTKTPYDVFVDTEVVGCYQALIKLPPIVLQFINSDNDGGMDVKVDVVAKEDGESVEHVVARYGITGNGRPNAWLQAVRVPWQTIISPSNLDLTNKKLKIRVWGQNDYNGDITNLNESSGFMEITSLASTSATATPTSYTSITQVDSDTATFDGGAPINFIAYSQSYL